MGANISSKLNFLCFGKIFNLPPNNGLVSWIHIFHGNFASKLYDEFVYLESSAAFHDTPDLLI